MSRLLRTMAIIILKMKTLRLRVWSGKTQSEVVLTYPAVGPSEAGGALTAVPVLSIHARATVVTMKAKTPRSPPVHHSPCQFKGSHASYDQQLSPLLTRTTAWEL